MIWYILEWYFFCLSFFEGNIWFCVAETYIFRNITVFGMYKSIFTLSFWELILSFILAFLYTSPHWGKNTWILWNILIIRISREFSLTFLLVGLITGNESSDSLHGEEVISIKMKIFLITLMTLIDFMRSEEHWVCNCWTFKSRSLKRNIV